ncbi:DUF134 domain-containing protein [bacterium]|nr:DUF134 domain-containing protein [bacterium]
MPRPHRSRWISRMPEKRVFEPAGCRNHRNAPVALNLDELEAMRQAYRLGRTQEEGAVEMGISRSTFGRILESANQKVTQALLEQRTLIISGGPVIMDKRKFECRDCGHTWEDTFGTGRPAGCPQCKAVNFTRIDAGPRGKGNCKHGTQGGQGRGHGGQHAAVNQGAKKVNNSDQ